MTSPALDIVLRGTNYPARWGVVEHWALNEASGVGLATLSSANNLTDNNTVTSAAGLVYPTARQFTAASSQYLSIADNAALSSGDIDFWLAGWIYFDPFPGAGNYPAIVGKYESGQLEYMLFYASTAQRFSFTVSANGSSDTPVVANTFGAPSLATWYFLLAHHDSVNNVIRISVNGGAFDSVSYSSGVRDGTSAFRVGFNTLDNDYVDGRIGPVAFGKSPPLGIAALATEIRDRLWNGGAGRPSPFR